jgi:hypothetical protein
MTISYTQVLWGSEGTTSVNHVVGEGTTLYLKTNSERVMSDIWEFITSAYYWDKTDKRIKSVWIDESRKVTLDGKLEDFRDEIFTSFYNRALEDILQRAEIAAKSPSQKNIQVKVVRGKSHKGTVGKVVVIKEMSYQMGWRSTFEDKLGIALDDEKHIVKMPNGRTYEGYKNMIWVWARNCEVVNPQVDIKYAEESAKRLAENELHQLQLKIQNTEKVA